MFPVALRPFPLLQRWIPLHRWCAEINSHQKKKSRKTREKDKLKSKAVSEIMDSFSILTVQNRTITKFSKQPGLKPHVGPGLKGLLFIPGKTKPFPVLTKRLLGSGGFFCLILTKKTVAFNWKWLRSQDVKVWFFFSFLFLPLPVGDISLYSCCARTSCATQFVSTSLVRHSSQPLVIVSPVHSSCLQPPFPSPGSRVSGTQWSLSDWTGGGSPLVGRDRTVESQGRRARILFNLVHHSCPQGGRPSCPSKTTLANPS